MKANTKLILTLSAITLYAGLAFGVGITPGKNGSSSGGSSSPSSNFPDVIVTASTQALNTKTSNPLYLESLEVNGDLYVWNLYTP